MDDVPLVSICCITYNHKNYIKDCLDSLLNQDTIFSFEILIHDDASTDGTADIIREYENKYPQIIRPVYQTVNQYSQGNRFINEFFLFPLTKGKYIALCEGDDYWKDKNKLQDQIDIFEQREDIGFCYTECNYFYQAQGVFSKKKYGGKAVSFIKILMKYSIPTASIVMRKCLLEQYLDEMLPVLVSHKWLMGDYPLSLWFSLNSRIAVLKRATSIYRVCDISASHFNGIDQYMKFAKSILSVQLFYLSRYFVNHKKYRLMVRKQVMGYNYRLFHILIQNGDLINAKQYLRRSNPNNYKVLFYRLCSLNTGLLKVLLKLRGLK